MTAGVGDVHRIVRADGDEGVDELSLGVHQDNGRTQAAYRRAGFVPSGVTFSSTIGLELEMVRRL